MIHRENHLDKNALAPNGPSARSVAFLHECLKLGRYDLHLHTNQSDGSHTAAEMVARAVESGLMTIAITDHDTVDAVPDSAQQVAENLLLIPGVELSAAYEGHEVHLLGYFPFGGIDQIKCFLTDQKQTRQMRNRQMIRRLNELGFAITQDEFDDSGQGTTGRLQAAMILRDRGYFATIKDAFDQLLGEGKPGYVDRPRPEIAEAIAMIHQAGGAAVLAHPALYGWCSHRPVVSSALLAHLSHLKKNGLDGVEAFHGEATPDEQIEVSAAALSLGLLRTAGSDDHGQNKSVFLMFDQSQIWPGTGVPEILVVGALSRGPDQNGQPTWLISRRAPGEKHAGFWELPGGKVEPGEEPAAALARELREELSVDAQIGEVRRVLSFDYPDQRVVLIAMDAKIDRQSVHLSVHDQLMDATATQALTMNVLPADIELFQSLL